MIELDVIAYLNNDDTLYDLLGASASDSKIYPVQAPQDATVPYIIYTTVTSGTLDENLNEMSMEFDCIDDGYSVSKNIRDRLQFLLDRQDSIQSLITSVSYYVYWAKKTGGNSFKDPDEDNFHQLSVYGFKYQELSRGYIDVINKVLTIPVFGTFVDEKVIFNGFYFLGSTTIKKIGIHNDVAPTGSSITIDIIKDDVEQTRIATLADGSSNQLTDITDISFSTSEKFGLKIKSIGSTLPGEGGTIAIHYQ